MSLVNRFFNMFSFYSFSFQSPALPLIVNPELNLLHNFWSITTLLRQNRSESTFRRKELKRHQDITNRWKIDNRARPKVTSPRNKQQNYSIKAKKTTWQWRLSAWSHVKTFSSVSVWRKEEKSFWKNYCSAAERSRIEAAKISFSGVSRRKSRANRPIKWRKKKKKLWREGKISLCKKKNQQVFKCLCSAFSEEKKKALKIQRI